MIYYKFVIIICHISHIALAKYNCGTKDVIYLEKGMITYFETANYPALLSQNQVSACNLTFVSAENDTVNHHLIISTTKKFFDIDSAKYNYEKSLNFLQTTFLSLQNFWKKDNTIYNQNFAQNGFVVLADTNKTIGCPSEYDKNPIVMDNELEVYFVLDNGIFNFSLDSCIWRFTAEKNYGFKVVIVDLDDAADTEFFVRNSTETFINKRSARKSVPHYNEDNYLEIQISNNHDTSFFAYVTIVKKTISKDYCLTTKNGNITTWHIDTYLFSKIFNVRCFFELIIPESIEYIVTVNAFAIEHNVDYIRYTDIHNNSYTVDVDPNSNTVFKLFNYNNGSNSRYLFEYENDGSVPSLGTVITFEKLTCRCAEQVIPCTELLGIPFGITGLMDEDDERYCGNLRCNFTIGTCNVSDDKGYVTVLNLQSDSLQDLDIIEYGDDIFKTYSNGHLTADLNLNFFHTYRTYFTLYFDFKSSNLLEISTFPTKAIPMLGIYTRTQKIPQVVARFEISLLKPFIVIDVGLYSTIKADNLVKLTVAEEFKNPSLIIHSNTAHGTQLFTNESLTAVYNSYSCFGDSNKYSCKLNVKEVVIYCPIVTRDFPILKIQLSEYHQKGCVFNNYIFIAQETQKISIVGIATPNDDCVVTVLFSLSSEYHYYITQLWTTSFKENIKVYAGSETFLFEFKVAHGFN